MARSSTLAPRAAALPGVLLLLLAMAGCAKPPAPAADPNPPAPGFDLAGSDPKAMEIADQVMAAMGGRKAWDETRYVRWNCFGRRAHYWDRTTGDVRIESRGDVTPWVILMNVNTREGRAWKNGREVTAPEERKTALRFGYGAWINDGYWLFMPYKLKDTGVTLRYAGESALEDGRPADVLELTFHGVGETPQNKYRVWVARDAHLVEQWAFFANSADEKPSFVTPCADWKRYGRILLSGDRGDKGKITEIAVYDDLPREVFTRPAPPVLPEPAPPEHPVTR